MDRCSSIKHSLTEVLHLQFSGKIYSCAHNLKAEIHCRTLQISSQTDNGKTAPSKKNGQRCLLRRSPITDGKEDRLAWWITIYGMARKGRFSSFLNYLYRRSVFEPPLTNQPRIVADSCYLMHKFKESIFLPCRLSASKVRGGLADQNAKGYIHFSRPPLLRYSIRINRRESGVRFKGG